MSTLRTNEIKMLDGEGSASFAFDALKPHPVNGPDESLTYLVDSSEVKVGQKVRTLGYYTPGDGGGNYYDIVAAGTETDDGGSFIDLSGSGYQAKGLFVDGKVKILQFGVTDNSASDEHGKVQNILDYIQSQSGGVLEGSKITVRCDFPLQYSGSNLKLHANGLVIDYSNATDPATILEVTGVPSSYDSLTQDAIYRENVIYVADTSIYSEGDLIEVSIDTEGSYTGDSPQVDSGQLNIIQEIDSANNKIVLDTVIFEELGYQVAENAKVRIIDAAENIHIDGLTVIGRGRQESGGDKGIVVAFGKHVTIENCDTRVENCDTRGCDSKSIEVISCYKANINSNIIYFDKIGNTIDSVSYGIAFSSSYFVNIGSNKVTNARHGILSSHISISQNPNRPIVSRFININGNHVTGNYGDFSGDGYTTSHAGISTHNDAEHVKILNNNVSGCKYGVNPRTWNIEIRGNTFAYNYAAGLYLSGKFHDLFIYDNLFLGSFVKYQSSSGDHTHDNISVINNKFYNSSTIVGLGFNNTEKSTGFVFSGNHIFNCTYDGAFNSLTVKGRVSGVISDNIITNSESGMRIEECEDLLIKGNSFKTIEGRLISVKFGTRVDVISNFSDYSGDISVDSDSSDCRVIDNHFAVDLQDESKIELSGNYETRG